MLLIRLPPYATDFLVTLNTPTFIHPNSAASEHSFVGSQSTDPAASELFGAIIRTLRIADYSFLAG